MKRLVLAVLLVVGCLVAVTGRVSGQPNQATKNKQNPTNNAANTVLASEHEGAAKHTAESDNDAPHWYTPLKRPEWWLVGVGIVTFIAIWLQVKEAGKATKAMFKSIGLQETVLQQWVDVVNWRTNLIVLEEQRAGVRIKVDIVNPTNFPLTLKDAKIIFDNRVTFFFRDDCFLTPKNPYTVEASLELTKGQYDYMYGAGVRIRVEGNLPHIGSLRRLQPQRFCGTLTCKDGKEARFESETPAADAKQKA